MTNPEAQEPTVLNASASITNEFRQHRTLRAALCLITRTRPRLLESALLSLLRLQEAEKLQYFIVVVENGLGSSEAANVLERIKPEQGKRQIILDHEPELGIPFARNKAIDVAIAHGADLVLFIDDDEVAPEFWLREIIHVYRNSELSLIGGPIGVSFEDQPTSWWSGVVQDGIRHRAEKIARRIAKRHEQGKEAKIPVLTNNWLAEASLFTQYQLRFDESFRYSGGSDTDFYKRAKAKGVKTGWAPKAFVYETVPFARATMAYQFHRSIEQSRMTMSGKVRKRGRIVILPTLISQLIIRMITIIGGLLISPFVKYRNLVLVVRSFGWCIGRVSGWFGARSTLYKNVTTE